MTALCANGHPVVPGARFCSTCGSTIAAAGTRSNRSGILLAIVIPLAIAALVIGLIIGMSGSGSDRTAQSPVESSTTTSPLPAATAAWVPVLASLPKPTTATEVTLVDGTPTAVTANGVPSGAWSGPFSVTVWSFQSGQWTKALSRDLDLPVSSIEMKDLTEDTILDAKVHEVTAAGPGIDLVLAGGPKGWRIVPFGPEGKLGPGGPIHVDNGPGFYTTSRACVPSCAQGGLTTQRWKYDSVSDSFLPN